jgi:hypothetical protein
MWHKTRGSEESKGLVESGAFFILRETSSLCAYHDDSSEYVENGPAP